MRRIGSVWVLLISAILLVLFVSPTYAWLSGWDYRQVINISNTAGDLTNYQVRIDLNSTNVGSHFNWNNNGSDIRFTDASDNLLNFWIESWNLETITYSFQKVHEKDLASEYGCWGNPAAVLKNLSTVVVYYQYPDVANYSLYYTEYFFNNNTTGNTGNIDVPNSSRSLDSGVSIKINDSFYVMSHTFHTLSSNKKWIQLRSSTDGYNFSNIIKDNVFGEESSKWVLSTGLKISSSEVWFYVTWYNDSSSEWAVYRFIYYINNGSVSTPQKLFTETGGELRWPSIFKDNNTYYLYYGICYGTDSGLYVRSSSDGVNFGSRTQLLSGSGEWRSSIVKLVDGKYYMVVSADDDTNVKLYKGDSPTSLSFVKTLFSSAYQPYMIKINDSRVVIVHSGKSIEHIYASVWDLEQEQTSNSATIWVNVTSLPNNQNTTIYMYYGNSEASSASDGDGTFLFFDDFDTDTIGSKWQIQTDSSTLSDTSTSYAKINTAESRAEIDSVGWQVFVTKNYTIERPFVVESKVNTEGYGSYGGGIIWYDKGTNTNTNCEHAFADSDSLNLRHEDSGGSYTDYQGTSYSSEENTWYVRNLILTSTQVISKTWTDNRNQNLGGYTLDNSANTGSKNIGLDHYVSGTSGTWAYFDWVFVRKYADPEPTVSSFGSEETALVSFSITLNSPANGTATCDPTPDFSFTVSGNKPSYSCELFINNIGYGTATANNNTATIITANQSLSNGTYYWYINCTAEGITNQSEARQITIDTTPPTTTATAVKDDGDSYTSGDWTNSNYVNITLSCSDSGAGCDVTQYCTDTSNTCTPNTDYTGTIQISTEGTTYIRYRSKDTLGNLEDTKSFTVKIDKTPPSITFNSGTTTAGWKNQDWIFVNVSVSDSLTSITNVYLEWDGTNETFDNQDGNTYWENKTYLDDKNYTYKVYAVDEAGNIGETELRIVSLYNPNLYRCIKMYHSGKSYYLTNNVSANGTCFVINASDVTLNCQGYTINFANLNDSIYYGVLIYGNHATVRNCNIVQSKNDTYAGGITIKGNYTTIEYVNITLKNGILGGILNVGTNTNISHCNIYGKCVGISSLKDNITISNCFINTTGNGITIDGADFFLEGADNNILYNNVVYTYNNHTSCLWIDRDSNNNIIHDNIFINYGNDNESYAIYFEDSVNNLIYNNILTSTHGYAIILRHVVTGSNNNTFYNNLFNCSAEYDPIYFKGTNEPNYFNTTMQEGTRIYEDGIYIGGNYWTNSNGTGYSDTCNDTDMDGFCDEPYNLTTNNIDYLPLSDEYMPYVSIYLWEEGNWDTPFNVSKTNKTELILICKNKQEFIYEMNSSNLTEIPTSCDVGIIRVLVHYSSGSYFREISPDNLSAQSTVNIYLADATETTVDLVVFEMTDTEFKDSKITVYREANNQTYVITQGYFDAEARYPTYLIENGRYSLVVNKGTSTYDAGYIYVVSPRTYSDPILLTISKINYIQDTKFISDNINVSYAINENTLSVIYSDISNQTISVNITIYEDDNVVYSKVFNNQNYITVDYNNYNSSKDYFIEVSVQHEQFGNSPLSFGIPVLSSSDITISMLPSWVYPFAAFAVIFFFSLVVTRVTFVGGAILTLTSVVLFNVIGWLNLLTSSIIFIGLIIIIAIMIYLRGEET